MTSLHIDLCLKHRTSSIHLVETKSLLCLNWDLQRSSSLHSICHIHTIAILENMIETLTTTTKIVDMPPYISTAFSLREFKPVPGNHLPQFVVWYCDIGRKIFISSYRSQSIIEGDRSGNSSQELEAESIEEHYLLVHSLAHIQLPFLYNPGQHI